MNTNECEVLIVDAFTRTAGQGNRAGVVLDARALTRAQMVQIAIGVGASETVFIVPETLTELSALYFTKNGSQVPICGHATIAGFHAYAAAKLDVAQAQTLLLHTDPQWTVGTLRVDVHMVDGIVRPTLTQGAVKFEDVVDGPRRARLVAALGICDDDIRADLPIQMVGTGHPKVMVPLKRRTTLNDLNPDLSALTAVSAELGPSGKGVFAFTLDQDDARYPSAAQDAPVLLHGRMFAPAIGIDEDPVTGNANGPVGAYLVHYGQLKPDAAGVARFLGRQGQAIGKAGVVDVAVACEHGEPVQVKISGDAVSAGTMKFSCGVDGVMAHVAPR